MRQFGELGEVKRAGRKEQADEGQQQRNAANHRVNEELERRVRPLRAAPELDEEERGNEAEFPEQEPVREVQRRERAEEAALQEEEEAAVERDVFLNLLRGQHGHRDDERGEHQHDQPEAVEADVILDAERGNPRVSLDELHRAVRRVGVRPQRGDEREREDVDCQREAPRELATLAADAENECSPHQRQEGQNRDERETVHAGNNAKICAQAGAAGLMECGDLSPLSAGDLSPSKSAARSSKRGAPGCRQESVPRLTPKPSARRRRQVACGKRRELAALQSGCRRSDISWFLVSAFTCCTPRRE